MTTRAAQRTITSILAGVIITIAIAWISAARMNPYECTLLTKSRPAASATLNTYELCSWCSVRRSWYVWEFNASPVSGPPLDFDLDNNLAMHEPRSPAEGEHPRHADKNWGITIDSIDDVTGSNSAPILQEARGWPWLAVQCSMTQPNFTWTADAGFILPFPRPPSPLSLRVLPYRPIWPGLLANTALFAVVFACLTCAARASLRALRRRRGLCPICRYDLSGNTTPGCPECGQGRARFTITSAL